MKIVKTLILSFVISASAIAQERATVSTSQTGGRYEIIQSPIARKYTLKLDKYSGNVWQYVNGLDGKPTWQSIPRAMNVFGTLVPYSITDEDLPNEVRYQIFMSGTMLRDLFLLNIETGQTWVLTNSSDDVLFFDEIKEPLKNNEEQSDTSNDAEEGSIVVDDL